MPTIQLSQGKYAIVDDPNDSTLPPQYAARLREALTHKWSYTVPGKKETGYAFRLIAKRDADGNIIRKPGMLKMRKDGSTYRTRGEACVTTQYLHRVLMQDYLSPERPHVDHKNGDSLDCRFANMRPATHAENMRNRKATDRPGRTSRFKGVFRRNRKSWEAAIGANGRHRYLGSFPTEEQAALAWNLAAMQLHGQFARLNPIDLTFSAY